MNVTVIRTSLDVTGDLVKLAPLVEPVSLTVTSGPVNASAAHTIELTSQSTLSALRAVTVDGDGYAVYADAATLDGRAVAGVTLNAGTVVTVQYSGPMSDAGWSWTPGRFIWVGADGALTQTPPTSGDVVVVGRALSETQIMIDLNVNIITI